MRSQSSVDKSVTIDTLPANLHFHAVNELCRIFDILLTHQKFYAGN